MLTSISTADTLTHLAEFLSAVLLGCIGFINCMHITMEQCEYNLKNNHLGIKSSNMTHTYKLTCNYRCCIFGSTGGGPGGGPGRWNDQTMVKLDKFINSICDGMMFSDNKFELNWINPESGKIMHTTFYGVYVICDNGYLDWSCTVPLYSMTSCHE